MRPGSYAYEFGLIDEVRYTQTMTDKSHIERTMEYLQTHHLTPSSSNLAMLTSLGLSPIADKTLLIHIIGREELDFPRLRKLLHLVV